MKNLIINKLKISNFKGIKDFEFSPMGNNSLIMGENGTGKSTIMDAFFWLLFGKDSHDKADFQLKPVTDNGKEIHNLETIVESVLEVNCKPITLKKVYKEIWTKKRGTTTKEHTGHTKKLYIDDVPKKDGEFKKAVAEIIDINAFKLVTNPFEFNNLNWQNRRQLLLEICGDITDQDVIDSDKKLVALTAILDDCSIDDHRKKVKEQQRKINDDLEEIPARIDELLNASKDVVKPEQKEKDRLDTELVDYQEKLRSLQNNERLSELNIKLNEVNGSISKLKADADQKQTEARKPILVVIEKLEGERRTTEAKIKELEAQRDVDYDRNRISLDAKDAKEQEWYTEDAKQPKNDNSCPACGQNLPKDQILEAIEKFNKTKSERLEKIETDGNTLKAGIDQREKDIAAVTEEIDSLSIRIIEIDATLKEKKKDLEAAYTHIDADDLYKEKDILESQINALKKGSNVQEENEQRHIIETQEKINEWNKLNAAYKAAGKSRDRIAVLEQEEKNLAKMYEDLSGEIYLLEQFTIQKVYLLENSINEKFKLARFKLFKEQINGGIDPCCEVLFNGVPFNHGLNSAAQINIGLDIINTLTEHYGFRGPVFLDNRESVNNLIPIESQTISLIVSKDKLLKVVVEDKKKKSTKAA